MRLAGWIAVNAPKLDHGDEIRGPRIRLHSRQRTNSAAQRILKYLTKLFKSLYGNVKSWYSIYQKNRLLMNQLFIGAVQCNELDREVFFLVTAAGGARSLPQTGHMCYT